MKMILVILLGLMALISGCIGQSTLETSTITLSTDNGNIEVMAEIADNIMSRSRGLMNRTSLGENSGMLFVFDGDKTRNFWMKNTLIPLDVIFVDSSLNVVDIQTMVPCESDPCTVYKSAAPAKYALEVNAGFVEKNGVKVGDKVSLDL